MNFLNDLSLVLYVPLYELDGSPVISKDSYGHLGTVTGAQWTPTGRSFDGDEDYLSVNHNAIFDVGTSSDFTWECWIYPLDSGSVRVIMSKDDSAGNAIGILMNRNSDNRIFFRIRQDAGNYKTLSGGTGMQIPQNQWSNVVVQRSGTNMKVFINGLEDTGLSSTSAGTGANSNPNNIKPIRIGIRDDHSQDYLGYIGEVRIYTRTLTPVEIQNNYLAAKWRYR